MATGEEESDRQNVLDDERYEILGRKDSIVLSSEYVLRRKLVRWVVRTAIGAILFSYLAWKFEWGKWLLYTWIPLACLSLVTILWGLYAIRKKGGKIEASIQSTR